MRTSTPRLLTVLALATLAGACGRQSGSQATPQATPGGGRFRAALVMSGPTTDNGWNAGALAAWTAVRTQLHLSPEDSPYVENVAASPDQEKNLRAFASQGFNVVLGHGNEYEALALRMEADYPKTLFIISSGGTVGHNTMPIVYKLEDGAYLLGMLAAGTSRTGTLGVVGAQPIPPVKSVFAAFAAGAKSVKPGIHILDPVYTGSWDDVSKAHEATAPLLQHGADIIMQDVDAAAKGVFEAVQQANRPDAPVYALGTNSNQNAAAPDVVLASAPIDSAALFVKLIGEARAGTLKPTDHAFGMQDGVVGFVMNDKLAQHVPAALAAAITTTETKIKTGKLIIPQQH